MSDRSSVADVVSGGLCCGCGTCVAVCPTDAVAMLETPAGLLVARVLDDRCTRCGLCRDCCPGVGLDFRLRLEARRSGGPLLSACVARSVRDGLQSSGQSGGLASGLAAYLLDVGEVDGVVSVVSRRDGSLRPAVSILRECGELSAAQGSKYCPVPLNTVLRDIPQGERLAVVGLACHMHGLEKMARSRQAAAEAVKYKIGLYCDRVLTYSAIDRMARDIGVDAADALSMEYRSKRRGGWPGELCYDLRSGEAVYGPNTVRRSIWEYAAVPRCRVCPDKLNCLSDLSVGDAWGLKETREGWSVGLVRTVRGQELLAAACAAGYVESFEVSPAEALECAGYERSVRRYVAFSRAWKARNMDAPRYGGLRGPEAPKSGFVDRWVARRLLRVNLRVSGSQSVHEAVERIGRARALWTPVLRVAESLKRMRAFRESRGRSRRDPGATEAVPPDAGGDHPRARGLSSAPAPLLVRWVIAVVGVIAGAAVASALPGGTWAGVVAFALVGLPLLVVVPKEWLVGGVLASVYALDGLWQAGILPRQATWATEVLVLVLLARVLAEAARDRAIPRWATVPLTLVALSILSSLLMGLAGGQDLVVGLLGIRKYAVFPVVGVCLLLGHWRDGLHRLLWGGFLVVAIAQVPVSVYQLLTTGAGDRAGGTLGTGGTGLLAIVLVCVACTVLAVGPRGDDRGRPIVRVLIALGLMVPAVIGVAIVALPLMGVGIAVVLLVRAGSWRRAAPAALGVLVAGVLLLPTVSAFTSAVGYPDPVALLSQPLFALNYGPIGAGAARPGRIDQALLAWRTVSDGGAPVVALGYGLFAASPSSFGDAESGALLRANPAFGWVTSSVGRGLAETGLLGVLAWTLVCLDCVRRGWRIRRGAGADTKMVAYFGTVVGVSLLVTSFYNDAWHEPATALLLWCAYALVIRAGREEPALGAGVLVEATPRGSASGASAGLEVTHGRQA